MASKQANHRTGKVAMQVNCHCSNWTIIHAPDHEGCQIIGLAQSSYRAGVNHCDYIISIHLSQATTTAAAATRVESTLFVGLLFIITRTNNGRASIGTT